MVLFNSGSEIQNLYRVMQIKEFNENHQKLIAKNLFNEESVLNLTIKCDFKEILNDRSEKSNYHDALMEINNRLYAEILNVRDI